MKLSELIYECVKDSIVIANSNMDYESFINDSFSNTKDYALQYAGVFSAVNLAIARLQTYDKIPYATKKMKIGSDYFDFALGVVVNVVELVSGSYKRLAYRNLNQGKNILILAPSYPREILVEYKIRIPRFSEKDIREIELDRANELVVVDTNIDLEQEYGISDIMCDYIKEFTKAQLLETIAPDISNNHNNRAEQYFQSLSRATTSFHSNKIKNSHGGLF
ncbi:MAG: hypothetical protein M0Q41_10740 [Bacteroidales bacterium]|nr:hypothetical protein [Acholeplasmataceae bacterium]MCK9449438.1 hypothetical protein [Bacteroidales bacterium]